MMFKKIVSLGIALFIASFANGQDLLSLKLNDSNNLSFDFSGIRNFRSTAIIFFLTDCPASQSYTKTLNDLYQQFGSQTQFIAVFPGRYSNDAEINSFVTSYRVKYPVVKDPDFKLAGLLHAEIAPSCFVVDSAGKTLYEGRIDDWYYSLGKTKPAVLHHNLRDALAAIRNKKNIPVNKTKAIGCILEYEN